MKTPITSLRLQNFIRQGNNYAIAMKECNHWHYSVNSSHYKPENMVAYAITFARNLSETDTIFCAQDANDHWYYFVCNSEEELLAKLASIH